MKTSLMLKEERASLISSLEALVDTAKTEEREFTQDEESRQADLNESIYSLDGKIANAEKTETIMARSMAGEASKSEERELDQHHKEYSLRDAVGMFTRDGRLTGREAEMQQEAVKEFREAGVTPSGQIQVPIGLTYRNTVQSSGVTGTQQQGTLQGLVPESVIEQAGGNRITGVSGTVRLPSLPSDATLEQTEVQAKAAGSAMTATDIDPIRFASRIDVSNQVLNLSNASFDAAVAAQFRRHSGGLMDKKAWSNFITAMGGTHTSFTLRSTTAAAAVPGIDFASANDLIAALGSADALNASGVFFGSHAQLARARSQQAVTNGGIPTLQADGTIAGYKAFGHSQITAGLLASGSGEEFVDIETNEVFVGQAAGTDVTNEGSLEPFFMVNMNDVYCCYWGGADLIIDNITEAHKGNTRMIMNYYANCNVGHAASVKAVYVA
jgi:hypothetical protein